MKQIRKNVFKTIHSISILSFLFLFICYNKPGIEKNGIVGKWKLKEAAKANVEQENYRITFEENGIATATDYTCSGTYTFNETGGKVLSDNSLVVEFKACSPTVLRWYSIEGKANARFLDKNTLVLNNETCDEGCARVFKRID